MEFDENEAIRYMRAHAGSELSARYPDDDELFNIIDLIYDYYEANGMLEIDLDDEDEELDTDDLMAYVERMLRKDKGAAIKPGDAEAFVNAYLEYENSLDE